MAPLRLQIGSQSGADHVVTETDGITEVTDHFAMAMRLENGVGGEAGIYSPRPTFLQNLCERFFFFNPLSINHSNKLHIPVGGKQAVKAISGFPDNTQPSPPPPKGPLLPRVLHGWLRSEHFQSSK